MSQSMYELAILDAKNLRRMAEEVAKNNIIKSFTPQIKKMVEEEIFGDVNESGDLWSSSWQNQLRDNENISHAYSLGIQAAEAFLADESNESQNPYSLKNDSAKHKAWLRGWIEVETEPDETEEEFSECDSKQLLLDKEKTIEEDAEEDTEEMVEKADLKALAFLVEKSSLYNKKGLNQRLKRIRRRFKLLERIRIERLNHSQCIFFAQKFNLLFKEALQIRRDSILIKESDNNQVCSNIEKTLKEINIMARRLNRGVFSRLFEQDETEELEELDATLVFSGEGEEDEELIRGLEDLELDVELVDEEELDVDEEELDVDEEEFELELEEDDDIVLDIDESALRQALMSVAPRRSRRTTTAPRRSRRTTTALRRSRRTTTAPRRSRRTRINESAKRVNGTLNEKIDRRESIIYKLQEQLLKVNLFNAKLLYANKLTQNKNLGARQQRTIVEALDSAKTIREAKLLYKSLSKSTSRRGKVLRESKRRVRGSSSKSTTQSGAKTLNEGVGLADRWATLAGISSDKK